MSIKNLIEVDDGIDIQEQRHLIEITNTMDRALTNDEFLAIVKIYNQAITRCLSKNTKK